MSGWKKNKIAQRGRKETKPVFHKQTLSLNQDIEIKQYPNKQKKPQRKSRPNIIPKEIQKNRTVDH
jgi:hypothetical protein